MSLSLLLALLEQQPGDDTHPEFETEFGKDPGPKFNSDATTWLESSEERRELLLQALYQALNEVLYDQATVDPAARGYIRGLDTPETRKPQPGRAIGALLAQQVSNDRQGHLLMQTDILALRRKLRHELYTHFDRLQRQVEPGSYKAGGQSSC